MDGEDTYTSGKTPGGKWGCAAAAVLGIALAFVVTGIALLSCPRDGDCQTEGQLILWAGLLGSALVAGVVGLLVRNAVNRWLARRPK